MCGWSSVSKGKNPNKKGVGPVCVAPVGTGGVGSVSREHCGEWERGGGARVGGAHTSREWPGLLCILTRPSTCWIKTKSGKPERQSGAVVATYARK